jgi:hypothetical protein
MHLPASRLDAGKYVNLLCLVSVLDPQCDEGVVCVMTEVVIVIGMCFSRAYHYHYHIDYIVLYVYTVHMYSTVLYCTYTV